MRNNINVAPMDAALVDSPDAEIVKVEAQLRAAQLNADVDALDRLISSDLLFTGPDGNLGTKEQDLSAYKSGVVRFLEHEPQELRIRRIGDNVAVASLLTRLVVNVSGNESRGLYRYTRVWARENGESWKVVGGHVSEVPSAG